MSNQKYLLGTDERQAWMRNYHFAPRGNGFKEPGVCGSDAKEFSAFNVAKSFYQTRPDVFNLALVANKLNITEEEAAKRLQRMYDERLIMLVKNSSVSTLGFGLYYWVVKMKKDAPAEAKKALTDWIQNKDEICTGYLCEGEFDFFCGNHMRTLDNLLCNVVEPIRRNKYVAGIYVCPIRRDVRESHVNLWDAPISAYRQYLWSKEQKTAFLKMQDKVDEIDMAIIDILNNVDSVKDMFNYKVISELSLLDEETIKNDLAHIVDEERYMVPMIYFNYQAFDLKMHCYLIRIFSNVASYRKEEICDELAAYPEFNNIFEFSDAYFDFMVTSYEGITDLQKIRALLDGYAEIEDIMEANSPRQFRRWTARLDANKDMWEECIFTDDFLQDGNSLKITCAGEYTEGGE